MLYQKLYHIIISYIIIYIYIYVHVLRRLLLRTSMTFPMTSPLSKRRRQENLPSPGDFVVASWATKAAMEPQLIGSMCLA